MRFMLKSTRLALRNSTTRIPFRYGKACMTCCPQAVMEAVIECEASPTIHQASGGRKPPDDASSAATDQAANAPRSPRPWSN
jgi:hypothetical protein